MVAKALNVRSRSKGPAFSAIKSQMKSCPGGLMPFRQFMGTALYSRDGFYNNVRFGESTEGNHFSTAPYEHGEALGASLGVFISNAWEKMGRPKELALVEAGPGEGKMMLDILDYLWIKRPDVFKALNVYMVEVSHNLINRQKQLLSGYKSKIKIEWINKSILETSLKGKFGIFVSNECLDQLPFSVHRFSSNIKRRQQRWRDRFYFFRDLYVKYNDKKACFEFVPVNEVTLRAINDDLSEWEVAKNRPLIKGHNFSATPETLAYQLFLSSNVRFPQLKEWGEQIFAIAPDSLSSYVKNTLSFETAVSLFVDYGVIGLSWPRFMFLDKQKHLIVELDNMARCLNEPGQRDITFLPDFVWTHRQASELGAEVFTDARYSLYDASGFGVADKGRQFVQILSKGKIEMKDLLDLPYREKLGDGLCLLTPPLFESSSSALESR